MKVVLGPPTARLRICRGSGACTKCWVCVRRGAQLEQVVLGLLTAGLRIGREEGAALGGRAGSVAHPDHLTQRQRSNQLHAAAFPTRTRKNGMSKGEEGPAPSPAVHQPWPSPLALAGRAVKKL